MCCAICEQEKKNKELKELFNFLICKECISECSNILMTSTGGTNDYRKLSVNLSSVNK